MKAGSRVLLQAGALVTMAIAALFFFISYVTSHWATSNAAITPPGGDVDSFLMPSLDVRLTHGLWTECTDGHCVFFRHMPSWLRALVVVETLAACLIILAFIVGLLGVKYKSDHRYTIALIILNGLTACMISAGAAIHRVEYNRREPDYEAGVSFYLSILAASQFILAAFLNLCDYINGPRLY